ncbi:MAG: hypothetical protein JNM56_26645, partial [Planctomycetia bacterium]|nr:hypothetical protein [Planctomycetia bacterium]
MHPLTLIGKAFGFSVFLVVTALMLAPVLAAVGMLLALAGMFLSAILPALLLIVLVWSIQYFIHASPPAGRCATGVLHGSQSAAARCCRSAGWLAGRSLAFVRRLKEWGSEALARLHDLSWRIGGVALETGCGALLLGGLAVLTKGNLPGRHQDEYVACAILAGLV